MAKLGEVCTDIRSKNAGPYWITVDMFFADVEALETTARSPAMSSDALGRLLEVDPGQIKRFVVSSLCVLKFSYPRSRPQGGIVERDMHGGQQYVRLLDVEV
jgi:hypothetical protein